MVQVLTSMGDVLGSQAFGNEVDLWLECALLVQLFLDLVYFLSFIGVICQPVNFILNALVGSLFSNQNL
jgi:hypothetical protein